MAVASANFPPFFFQRKPARKARKKRENTNEPSIHSFFSNLGSASRPWIQKGVFQPHSTVNPQENYKFMGFMVISWDFMAISRDLWWFHGIYGDFMGFMVISWDLWWFHGIYGDFMGFMVTSWDLWWFHGIYGDFMGFMVTSWDLWWFHGIYGDFMGFRVISWDLWWFHGMVNSWRFHGRLVHWMVSGVPLWRYT